MINGAKGFIWLRCQLTSQPNSNETLCTVCSSLQWLFRSKTLEISTYGPNLLKNPSFEQHESRNGTLILHHWKIESGNVSLSSRATDGRWSLHCDHFGNTSCVIYQDVPAPTKEFAKARKFLISGFGRIEKLENNWEWNTHWGIFCILWWYMHSYRKIIWWEH